VANSKLKDNKDGFLTGAMQKANTQVKKMTSMINGFLNVSRLESAKLLIEKQDFQLDELVQEVIDETIITVRSHPITFDPCPPVAVSADRDKISSVISNLIGNAVKYSPKGSMIAIDCVKENDKVIVSVKDQGMGIKADDVTKIFNRYYRVAANNAKHISGFGIGLYLSAEIVQVHQGEIWVESEYGQGSTFFFNLPLNR
jgi:two-component system, OmpR family, sensor histidine kinase VicK